VPILRKLAKEYLDLPLRDTESILKSKYHEERLLALLIMVGQFAKGGSEKKQYIYDRYLDHTQFINNWDLVDCSAYKIVGPFLMNRSRSPLYQLAGSDMLWERRIAIMSTFHFIKNNEFTDTLQIAEVLLTDPEDLIHKAVGWMLREIGKRHLPTEETFLKKHYPKMPRTMLRYAIEKFPEPRRQQYLKGKV
jgi:3-methyladenine DNA glycosylase AlkD